MQAAAIICMLMLRESFYKCERIFIFFKILSAAKSELKMVRIFLCR